MRRLLGLALITFATLSLAVGAFAANTVVPTFQPGPRLIDGNDLNKLSEAINGQAYGEAALDGSNPTPVTTGLSSITGCSVTLKGSSAPGVNTSVLTYTTSGGTLSVYAWKVTDSSTTTLIASTGTESFGWSCFGAR